MSYQKPNEQIRAAARRNGLPLWQLADMLGMSENTLYRRLRHELPAEDQDRIVELIKSEAARNE